MREDMALMAFLKTTDRSRDIPVLIYSSEKAAELPPSRFWTVAGSKGFADLARDVRGFAVQTALRPTKISASDPPHMAIPENA